MGVWFIGGQLCQLCPLVGLLVALDFVVARAPPDLKRSPSMQCFLAAMAHFWPGPGSSEVILRMVARAFVKIVIELPFQGAAHSAP